MNFAQKWEGQYRENDQPKEKVSQEIKRNINTLNKKKNYKENKKRIPMNAKRNRKLLKKERK